MAVHICNVGVDFVFVCKKFLFCSIKLQFIFFYNPLTTITMLLFTIEYLLGLLVDGIGTKLLESTTMKSIYESKLYRTCSQNNFKHIPYYHLRTFC